MKSSVGFRLQLFGSPGIAAGDGVLLTRDAAQRHRIALLSLLALAPGSILGRDKLMALLWPERDTAHARRLLNQSVYALRNALGHDALITGVEGIRLNRERIRDDVTELEAALARGDLEGAVSICRAPFLDGFFLPDAEEFESWVEQERARLAAARAKAIEQLADAADAEGDAGAAAGWWKMLASQDPYDSRVALRLMQALEAGGHRGGAVQHAADHQRRLQEQLGAEPDADVMAFAERLRQQRPPPRNTLPEAPSVTGASVVTLTASSDDGGDGSGVSAPRGGTAATGLRVRVAAWCFGAVLLLGAVFFATRRDLEPPTGMLALARTPRTENVAAHDLYIRASDPALLRTDSTARVALEYLRQAVALDSSYAPAWASMSRLYSRIGSAFAETDRRRHDSLARDAALRSVALDDSLAEGHAALGIVHMRSFETGPAEVHLTRALELDATLALAHEWLVGLFIWTGRAPEALAQARRALELDPLSPLAHAVVARALIENDRCDEAEEHLARIGALEPPLLRTAPLQAICFARGSMWAEAIDALRAQAEGGEPNAFVLTAYMLARAGREHEARQMRAAAIERWRNGYGNVYQLAVVSAGLRDFDDAFAWLDAATSGDVPASAPGLVLNLILMGPLSEDLAGDPRFERVRERLGLRMRFRPAFRK